MTNELLSYLMERNSLFEIWCNWCSKKIDSDDFAMEFHKIFKRDLDKYWQDYHKRMRPLKERILSEMVVRKKVRRISQLKVG